MVYLSRKNYNGLLRAQNEAIRKAEKLELEVKGYYDTMNEQNDYFKSVFRQLKALELPPVIGEVSRQKIMEIYQSSAPVQGVVNLIADNVGDIMRYYELSKDGEYVDKHWLLDLLRRPNDRFTLRKFGIAWAVNRLVFGDAFTFCPETVGAERRTEEMYIIPGWRVAVKNGVLQPMEGIKVLGYKQQSIDMNRVFESFDYNLDDSSFFGTSKIVAAAVYLDVMEKGMRRQDTALKNGGVNNIITPAKDNMGVMPKDADKVEDTFNDKKNIGKTLALRMPIEVHQLGNAPVDLDILSSHKEAVTALCFVYKIPVDLYYGQSKYENAKEAKRTIYEQQAIPLANEFAEDLIHFLKLDDEGYELKVNTDLIDVLKDNPGDVLDNLEKMHATLNEMREAYGYERIEEDWADQPMIPMGVSFGNEAAYDIDETRE